MSTCEKLKDSKHHLAYINHDEEAFYRHKRDMQCISDNPSSLLAKAAEEDARNR